MSGESVPCQTFHPDRRSRQPYLALARKVSNQMPEPATTAQRPLAEQIEQANASGRTPVVFVHGLWLLASSWDRWAEHFAEAGYAPVSPGWPDDPARSKKPLPTRRSSRTRPSARWPATTR